MRKIWTRQEKFDLVGKWGNPRWPVARLRKHFGCKDDATIIRQAVALGLKTGAPAGWLKLASAAKLAGVDRQTLAKALDRLDRLRAPPPSRPGVRPAPAIQYSRTDGARRGRYSHRIVSLEDLHLAIAVEARLETVTHAARRLGTFPQRLRLALLASGLEPPPLNKHWRLEPGVVDAVWQAVTQQPVD